MTQEAFRLPRRDEKTGRWLAGAGVAAAAGDVKEASRVDLGVALSQGAAYRIWEAHQEIRVGRELLKDITDSLKSNKDEPPHVDAFGRRRHLQLSVPSDRHSSRVLNVSAQLSIYIIEAHIAAKQKELIEATIAARIELENPA